MEPNIIGKLDEISSRWDCEMRNFTRQLNSLQGEESKSDEVENLRKQFTNFTKSAFEMLKILRESIEKVETRVDEVEQYSRRNCILLHGVPETAAEEPCAVVCDVFKNKLGLDIKILDIDRAHRLGRNGQNSNRTAADIVKEGSRPIIVKFVSYASRALVFKQKVKLKGTKIFITESLTKHRLQLYKMTKEKFGIRNVWTSDGRIVINVNNRKYFVSHKSELTSVPPPPPPPVCIPEGSSKVTVRQKFVNKKT